MRAAAWNLGHQTYLKPIRDEIVRVLVALDVDAVAFNEFVDGPGRGQFRADLDDAGFGYQIVSLTPSKHNQVLVASRTRIWAGDIRPPQLDGSAVSNFQHVVLPDHGLELVGLRVPYYTRDEHWKMKPYLDQLGACLAPACDRALVVAGDFNANPFNADPFDGATGAKTVPWATCPGLAVHEPAAGWSFHSGRETATPSRIDHVAATPTVQVRNVAYVPEVDGVHLAGLKELHPISDHAPIVFSAVAV